MSTFAVGTRILASWLGGGWQPATVLETNAMTGLLRVQFDDGREAWIANMNARAAGPEAAAAAPPAPPMQPAPLPPPPAPAMQSAPLSPAGPAIAPAQPAAPSPASPPAPPSDDFRPIPGAAVDPGTNGSGGGSGT